MASFTNADRMAEVCRQITTLTGRWDTDHRVAIDAVRPLEGAWLAIVYRNPAVGPRLGLVFDLDDFGAGLTPELRVADLAGEIVQSFIIEPGRPGLENAHPWLEGLNEKFGPLGWRGDAVKLPRNNRTPQEQVLPRLVTGGVQVEAHLESKTCRTTPH